MDAGRDIIGGAGWNAATVRRVSAQAKVGPRFFYECFTDMTALAEEVHDELSAQIRAHAVEAIAAAPEDLHAKSWAAANSVIRDLLNDPRRARFLLSDAPELAARKTTAMRLMGEEVARQARLAGVDIGDERKQQAIALVIAAGSAELVIATLDGSTDLTPDEVVETCTHMLNMALGGGLPRSAQRTASSS